MKVLLIYPALDAPLGINHGLAMISAVLKAQGHTTRLIHLHEKLSPVPDQEDILRTAEEEKPDVIGFSILTQQYEFSLKIASHLKKHLTIPIVAGGIHCTMAPTEVLETRVFDYIFLGEAEYTFVQFVNCLENGKDPRDIYGIGYHDGERAIIRHLASFPRLDNMPMEDYGLFDLSRIFKENDGWFSIITSRGCPYSCTYCFNKAIVELYKKDGAIRSIHEYLRHSQASVIIDEIMSIKATYPVKFIIFDDDLFTLDQDYVENFASLYIKSGVDIPFVVNAHVQNFNDRIARALKDAGCRIVKFGIESGNQRIQRDILNRFTPNHKIEEAFEIAHSYGLHTSAFIMLGLPQEGREELLDTLKLCAKIRVGRFRWAFFYPYPGTPIYEKAIQCGLIPKQGFSEKGGNYFDRSFLDFGEEYNLFLDKLAFICHWYVNAFMEGPAQQHYIKLVEEVESWDRERWESELKTIREKDRTVSEEFLNLEIPHYAIRYTQVMAVHSDYILNEIQRNKCVFSEDGSNT